jgi:hypothetical protein
MCISVGRTLSSRSGLNQKIPYIAFWPLELKFTIATFDLEKIEAKICDVSILNQYLLPWNELSPEQSCEEFF